MDVFNEYLTAVSHFPLDATPSIVRSLLVTEVGSGIVADFVPKSVVTLELGSLAKVITEVSGA